LDGRAVRVANPTNLERVNTNTIPRHRGIGIGIGMGSQEKVTSLVKVPSRVSLVTAILSHHLSHLSPPGVLPAGLPVDQAVNPRVSQWSRFLNILFKLPWAAH